MKSRVTKRNAISLVAEFLLATALIFSSTPTSIQAFVEDSKGEQARETTPADQHFMGEQESAVDPVEKNVEATKASESVVRHFVATAYCIRGTTAAGTRANIGSVAADPAVLPMGSIIRLHAGKHSGIYTVLDTGPRVRGRRLDIWFPSYRQAAAFGVRRVRLEVLRYGWEPADDDAIAFENHDGRERIGR
jgi:3D (Asp-Asp-Asp) domain-containing protein